MTPPGQRDYSDVRLTRHALDRFVERFGAAADASEPDLRDALRRTRQLGRNPANGASAVLALYQGRALIAVLHESTCLTILTWSQFESRLAEFGRPRLPRKRGRWLHRLSGQPFGKNLE